MSKRLPDIKLGMAARRGSAMDIADRQPYDFGDVPSKSIRSKELGIYSQREVGKANLIPNQNYTPISCLKYTAPSDREGRGNLSQDHLLQSLMGSQSKFSKNQLEAVSPGLGQRAHQNPSTISLKNDVELPIFGDALSRMPQNKDIQLQQIRTILPSLNKDQIRLLNYEHKLNKLKEKQIKAHRQRELLEWAKIDYGIDMMQNTQTKFGAFSGSKYRSFYKG